MGSWGFDIFENDSACDLKYIVEEYRSNHNASLNEAISVFIENKKNEKSSNGKPCPYYVLKNIDYVLSIAELQMQENCLTKEIKETALYLINNENLSNWREPGKRMTITSAFKEKLNSYDQELI